MLDVAKLLQDELVLHSKMMAWVPGFSRVWRPASYQHGSEAQERSPGLYCDDQEWQISIASPSEQRCTLT